VLTDRISATYLEEVRSVAPPSTAAAPAPALAGVGAEPCPGAARDSNFLMRSRTLPVLTSALAFSALLTSLLLLLLVSAPTAGLLPFLPFPSLLALLLLPLFGRLEVVLTVVPVVRGTQ
jgi:hypothetical protein